MPLINELDPIIIEVAVAEPVIVEVDVPADVQLPDTDAVQLTVITQEVKVEVQSPGPQVQAIIGVGLDGWSPMLAIVPRVSDGALVLQVVDWIGGTDTKPDVGDYLGTAGFVSDIADARNIKGADGTNGTNGTAIILGMGDPASNVGRIGDLYIDLSAFRLWDKSSGDWTLDGTFKGTDGEDGDDGDPGAPGATLRWGHGAPAPGLGADGDEYTDIDTWDVYGKEAGAWEALGNIKGAPGTEGDDGDDGEDGASLLIGDADPDGAVGKDRDTFLNRITFDIFSRDAGVWTLAGNIKGAMAAPGRDGEDGADAWPIPGAPGRDGETIVIPGRDGEDGADAFTIPGQAGLDGSSTLVPGRDGTDGEDAFPIPGIKGDAGTNGIDGLNGVSIPGRDGDDGDSPSIIPGPSGERGLASAPGRDGEDGQDAWPIPGPQGLPGIAASVIPGRDGEDGTDAPYVPGKDGVPGGYRYIFNSSLAAADPGDGKLSLNNTVGSFAAVTMNISRKCADGPVVALLLSTIINSGQAATIVFKSRDGTQTLAVISTPATFVDNVTYYTFTIAMQAGSSSIGNGTELFLDLVRYGTNGAGVPTGGTIGQFLKKNSGTNFDTVWVNFPARQPILTSAADYYVDTALGNDANAGLAPGGAAFKTIQKAINTVATLDVATFGANIHVADGTYAEIVTVNGPWVGSGTVTLIGNVTTPANCVIDCTSFGGAQTSQCIGVQNGASLTVMGFKVRNAAVGAVNVPLLVARFSGTCHFTNMDFGVGGRQVMAASGGQVYADGGYNVTAGASYHWFASLGGGIVVEGRALTITGTPAFVAWGFGGYNGAMVVDSNSYTGAATGKRFECVAGGGIAELSGNINALPGNAAGTTGTAPALGWYA